MIILDISSHEIVKLWWYTVNVYNKCYVSKLLNAIGTSKLLIKEPTAHVFLKFTCLVFYSLSFV